VVHTIRAGVLDLEEKLDPSIIRGRVKKKEEDRMPLKMHRPIYKSEGMNVTVLSIRITPTFTQNTISKLLP
jgi:hypothetical protein